MRLIDTYYDYSYTFCQMFFLQRCIGVIVFISIEAALYKYVLYDSVLPLIPSPFNVIVGLLIAAFFALIDWELLKQLFEGS